MLAQAFVKVHSSNNLKDEGQRGKERVRGEYPGILDQREVVKDALNVPFTLGEIKRAIAKAEVTSPGKDEMCYIVMARLSDTAMGKVLGLYNKVWQEGKLPDSWKQAVVVSIWKPGKGPTYPSSYRPIALTSHVCKRGLMSSDQGGFRKGRGTMDPVLCLQSAIRKAQANKEVFSSM